MMQKNSWGVLGNLYARNLNIILYRPAADRLHMTFRGGGVMYVFLIKTGFWSGMDTNLWWKCV